MIHPTIIGWVGIGIALLIIGLSMYLRDRRHGWHRVTPPPPEDYPTEPQEQAFEQIAWRAMRTGKTITGNVSPDGEIFNVKEWDAA